MPVAVDYDPFAQGGPTPVDYDPFGATQIDHDPFGSTQSQDASHDQDETSWLDLGSRVLKNVVPTLKQIGAGFMESSAQVDPVTKHIEDTLGQNPKFTSAVSTIQDSRARQIEQGKALYSAADQDIKANAPNVDPESAKGYAFDISNSVVQMVPALAVTLATRNPSLGLSTMGGQVFGQQYGSATAEGQSPEDARGEAAFYTAAETLTEKVPLGILTKEGGKLLPRVAKSLGAEGIQEGLTQAIEQAYEARKISQRDNISFRDAWDQAGGWDGVRRAATVGAATGGGLALATHALVGGEEHGEQQPRIEPRISPEVQASLTPDDHASPIPTNIIAEGKQLLADAGLGPDLPEGAVSADTLFGTPTTSSSIPQPDLRARQDEASSEPIPAPAQGTAVEPAPAVPAQPAPGTVPVPVDHNPFAESETPPAPISSTDPQTETPPAELPPSATASPPAASATPARPGALSNVAELPKGTPTPLTPIITPQEKFRAPAPIPNDNSFTPRPEGVASPSGAQGQSQISFEAGQGDQGSQVARFENQEPQRGQPTAGAQDGPTQERTEGGLGTGVTTTSADAGGNVAPDFGKVENEHVPPNLVKELPSLGKPAPAPPASVGENIERGKAAVEKVLSQKSDEAFAIHRKALGWVGLYWGTKTSGVQHLIEQRMAKDGLTQAQAEDMVRAMPEVIAKGLVGRAYLNASGQVTRNVVFRGKTAVLGLVRQGERKTWLVTAFGGEKEMPIAGKRLTDEELERAVADATRPGVKLPTGATQQDHQADLRGTASKEDTGRTSPAETGEPQSSTPPQGLSRSKLGAATEENIGAEPGANNPTVREDFRGPGDTQIAADLESSPNIRRGANAIIARLRTQVGLDDRNSRKAGPTKRHSFDNMDRNEVKEVEDFIDFIGEHMFRDVGLRIQEGDGPKGRFNFASSVVDIYRKAIREGMFTRTAVHELWHALSRSVPSADRAAVINEYQRERTEWLKKNPWAEPFLSDKTAAGGELLPMIRGEKADRWVRKFRDTAPTDSVALEKVNGVNTARMVWTEENYRFKDADEFFAETMADKYFKHRDIQDAKAKSVLGHARDIFQRMVASFKRLFGRDATGRIFDGFAKGEFGFKDGLPLAVGRDVVESDVRTKSQQEKPRTEEGRFASPTDHRFKIPRGTFTQERAINKAIAQGDNRSILEKVKDSYQSFAENLKDEFTFAVADEFHGLRRLGRKLDPTARDREMGGYVAARLARHSAGQLEAFLRHGAPEWDAKEGILGLKKESKGFYDIIAPVYQKGLERLFEGYAYARRVKTQDLIAQEREHNLKSEEVDALLSLADDHPEFKKVFAGIQEYKKSVLDAAEAMGLVNKEQRAVWEQADHVPFYRAVEEGQAGGPGKKQGLSGQSDQVRRLTGGDRRWVVVNNETGEVVGRHEDRADAKAQATEKGAGFSVEAAGQPAAGIVENLAKNVAHLIDASMKNHAAVTAIDEAVKVGWAEKVPAAQTQALVPQGAMVRALQKAGLSVKGEADGVQAVTAITSPVKPGNNIVAVRRNGETEYYAVSDPMLYKGLTAMHRVMQGWWWKPLATLKNVLTRSVTSTPTFMLRNFMRDSQSAWMISEDRGLNPFREGLKSLKSLATTSKDGRLRDLMASGGDTGWYQNAPADVVKQLKRMESDGTAEVMSYANPAKLWHLWERLGRASEMSNRLAAYDATLKATGSKRQAAFDAADLMDFQLRGGNEQLQLAASIIPFLNARVQGLYKLGRASTDKTSRRAFLSKAAIITAFSLILATVNATDDDYNDLPETLKDLVWVLPVWRLYGKDVAAKTGLPKFIFIPKGFELGLVFGTAPERMVQALAGNDRMRDTWNALVRAVSSTFAINPFGNPLTKELLEQYVNKDFFTGSPIVNQTLQYLPSEMQYTGATTETAKGLGKVLGMSPVRLEHAIRGFLGDVGMFTLATGDALARTVGLAPQLPRSRMDELPIVKAFIAQDPARNTKWVDRFYEAREEAETSFRGIKAMSLAGDREGAREKQREDINLLRARPQLDKVGDALGIINKRMRIVEESATLTPAEKRMRLDQLTKRKNELAKRAAQAAEQRSH